MTTPATSPALIRAAQYVRMSTEHQQYSTKNQEDAIREYTARRGYEIVRTYADAGKSGLNVAGREQLRQLIADVQSGQADFRAILVYDISRWGRFQDADESAYYEYLCKRAGIEVHYCAEQFENDGGPTSTIIKSVKRAMAGGRQQRRRRAVLWWRPQSRLEQTSKAVELGGRFAFAQPQVDVPLAEGFIIEPRKQQSPLVAIGDQCQLLGALAQPLQCVTDNPLASTDAQSLLVIDEDRQCGSV